MSTTTPAYEWIFSGVGVAVCAWVVTWIYRRFRERASDSSAVNISNLNFEGPVAGRDVNIGTYIKNESAAEKTDEFSETPTPEDIRRAVEAASMYMQEAVAQSFVGVKVRWRGTLSEIWPRNNLKNEVGVQVRCGFVTIHVIVRFSEYPILKTVRGGEQVEITGTIERPRGAGDPDMYLKNARLKFLV